MTDVEKIIALINEVTKHFGTPKAIIIRDKQGKEIKLDGTEMPENDEATE